MENITNTIERNLGLVATVASWTALTLITLTICAQIALKVGA